LLSAILEAPRHFGNSYAHRYTASSLFCARQGSR
jgi:hypothetical protein